MHIEPGVVDGARIALGYGTAAAAFSGMVKVVVNHVRDESVGSLAVKGLLASAAVFVFFEVFPHYPVGVSEVHLILGTSLLLIFGTAPAAIGLATGLLVQGLLFAPTDLPQFGMNVTTLLIPLYATHLLARRIISPDQAFVNLKYSQVLRLSAVYQGGIVAWVAFWAFYGQGITQESFNSVARFGGAYLSVIMIEPLVDLALLWLAKTLRKASGGPVAEYLLNPQLYQAE